MYNEEDKKKFDADPSITAILCKWKPQPWFNGRSVYRGDVYLDRKNRFDDGYNVTTSYLKSGPDENGVIVTENSKYLLAGR